MLTIFIVSGGTCDTADRVAQAALAQFENAPVRLVRRANVRSAQVVRDVVGEARLSESVILHTFVSDDLRHLMVTEARLGGVDEMDVLGPVLERFSARLKLAPLGQPGRSSKLQQARWREIEAVDYAFRHDDGQRVEEIDRAEVVLVGISRTMKTPTMLYLAYRGWFAANVPIVPEVPPPAPLVSLPPERVFCLTISTSRLRELRLARARQAGIPEEPYASLERLRDELRHAERLSLAHRWRKIEVTDKSVEEVSREIIAFLSQDRAGAQSATLPDLPPNGSEVQPS